MIAVKDLSNITSLTDCILSSYQALSLSPRRARWWTTWWSESAPCSRWAASSTTRDTASVCRRVSGNFNIILIETHLSSRESTTVVKYNRYKIKTKNNTTNISPYVNAFFHSCGKQTYANIRIPGTLQY